MIDSINSLPLWAKIVLPILIGGIISLVIILLNPDSFDKE